LTPTGKLVLDLDLRSTVQSATNIAANASGGTASADASGGDRNQADARSRGDRNRDRHGDGASASAGNGGTANAEASGGTVVIGDVDNGDNSGSNTSDKDHEKNG
jgi:hypothetical protein